MRAFLASLVAATLIAVVAAVALEQFDWSAETQSHSPANVRLN